MRYLSSELSPSEVGRGQQRVGRLIRGHPQRPRQTLSPGGNHHRNTMFDEIIRRGSQLLGLDICRRVYLFPHCFLFLSFLEEEICEARRAGVAGGGRCGRAPCGVRRAQRKRQLRALGIPRWCPPRSAPPGAAGP